MVQRVLQGTAKRRATSAGIARLTSRQPSELATFAATTLPPAP